MTKPEARQILRRYQNWRQGRDVRDLREAFPEEQFNKILSAAIEHFAAPGPVINCETCSHCSARPGGWPQYCGLDIHGECHHYDPVPEE
jgi:hypothetical protein